MNIIKGETRFTENRTGFKSHQLFSFAGQGPAGEAYASIRVFNDDHVENGVGIPLHPHSNMEIITVMLEGQMHHSDSLFNHYTLQKNDLKLMSSGEGLYHGGTCFGETNFLQIWVDPEETNTKPEVFVNRYQELDFSEKWKLMLSPDYSESSLMIKQQLWSYRGKFSKSEHIAFSKNGNYMALLFLLNGTACYEKELLERRDALQFEFLDNFSLKVNNHADLWLMIVENENN